VSGIDILLAQPIRPVTVDILRQKFVIHTPYDDNDPDAALSIISPDIRALAVGPAIKVNRVFIEKFPKLELISFYGVGYDVVDVETAVAKNIMVTNTPDVLTEEVADTAIGLMIMTVRELGQAERYLRDGRWLNEGIYPFTQGTLRGKTVGILGLGRIGKAIARRAQSFGLEIIYHGRNRQNDVTYRYFDDLSAMAKACDILIVSTPGGAATHHIVDGGVLAALGPDGILINIGRGSTVNELTLIEALSSQSILAAGLDVYETEPAHPIELMETGRVVLLPHVASASIHTRDLMGELVAKNIVSWFEIGTALTPVPECAHLGA